MKLKCIVSGKEVNVSPKTFTDRAQKYGVSEDALKVGYVSRESKRLLREGKTVDEIRAASGVDVSTLAAVPQDVLDKVLAKKKVKKEAAPTAEAPVVPEVPAAEAVA
jgi:hypothetical protein